VSLSWQFWGKSIQPILLLTGGGVLISRPAEGRRLSWMSCWLHTKSVGYTRERSPISVQY